MNEEIDNDPDFEENSIDPFNSDESEIDDSDHENNPPLDRIGRFQTLLRESVKFSNFENFF